LRDIDRKRGKLLLPVALDLGIEAIEARLGGIEPKMEIGPAAIGFDPKFCPVPDEHAAGSDFATAR
jgi:hypothetical protein